MRAPARPSSRSRSASATRAPGGLPFGRQPAEGAALAPACRPKPRVLILDEPTRGVDIGAKSEIYRIMDELARSGIGDHLHLARAAGDRRHRRPRARDARRPDRRRVDPASGHRRSRRKQSCSSPPPATARAAQRSADELARARTAPAASDRRDLDRCRRCNSCGTA